MGLGRADPSFRIKARIHSFFLKEGGKPGNFWGKGVAANLNRPVANSGELAWEVPPWVRLAPTRFLAGRIWGQGWLPKFRRGAPRGFGRAPFRNRKLSLTGRDLGLAPGFPPGVVRKVAFRDRNSLGAPRLSGTYPNNSGGPRWGPQWGPGPFSHYGEPEIPQGRRKANLTPRKPRGTRN